MSYVVCVTFHVKPEFSETFKGLVIQNAKASLDNEANCKRFDVSSSPSDNTKIFLYEIYLQESDFQAHLQTSHFLEFNAATKHMIKEKTVDIYGLEN